MTQTPDITKAEQKKSLRRSIRGKRRALSKLQQHHASEQLYRNLNRHQCLLRATHIALYLGQDGEIDPSPFITKLIRRKKKVFLPVLSPLKSKRLYFCQISTGTRYRTNKFGIPEPELKTSRRISARFLSLVLLPLVAFDHRGNRMGMGGGYYDRTFAFKQGSEHLRPQLLGIAHELQGVECLPTENWDIPLNGIITDSAIYQCKRR